MRRSWASVTVGALVILVLGISYLLVRSTSEHSAGSQGYSVWGLFHDASGLFEKSRVQTAGISVGQIEKRELDPKTARAKITLRMQPSIVLYENAVVSKKSASLLGEYYLEIYPGTPYAEVNGQRQQMRVLKDGDEIKHVLEPTAMGDIINDVATLMPILKDILEDVRKLTSGTITNIAENINDLIETNSDVLERLLNRVDHIAANVEGVTSTEAEDVKVAIKNVREITESIKGLVGTTQGQVANVGGGVRTSLDRLQSTITNLEKTMKNMESVTDKVDKGQGTVGRLVNDDTIARNVEDITEDAGGFIKGITKLQTIVGLRTDYNVVSSSFKSYISITLLPRPDKFYLIQLVQDQRGYTSSTRTVTQSSTTGPTEQLTTTTTEQLKFTLMLGKKVRLLDGAVGLDGRFGIIESTGGFGGDLALFHDNLLLSVDVFDMYRNKFPRVRGTLSYSVWNRNLFAVVGADDLFNYARARGVGVGGFDWFLGGQLVFNDEDLKSLLLFGGGFLAGAASQR
jgi:phospholipid/cholesterol/gamma-HCH transport system substrate-binding protein